MSKKSDEYEIQVANYIDSFSNVIALRPKFGTQYSDVLVIYNMTKSWLEVKMNHGDNLANPRFYYNNNKWETTYSTPLSWHIIKELNQSDETKSFIDRAIQWQRPSSNLYLSTNRGDISNSSFNINQMTYFMNQQKNRYILDIANVSLGSLVTQHYMFGKTESVPYIQIQDDFYFIGNTNPLELPDDVPTFDGYGPLRVRVSTRTKFYEIQSEIKIKETITSDYSLKPGTKKKNPFGIRL